MERAQSITEQQFSTLAITALRSLAYSEVFSYPLTLREIRAGLEVSCENEDELRADLLVLEENGIVFKKGEFYSLSEEKGNFKRRQERNARAEKYLVWAKRISRFIGSFPFVRAVYLSGSISKNSMDKDSDIDYFIITEPGKLWLTRSLLILFKKIFLFNSYKLFCLNYFIDSKNLEIKDRNIYVAHEIASLIPTYGKTYCEQFNRSNTWITTILPNARFRDTKATPESKRGVFKSLMELLLSNGLGNWSDRKLKQLTQKYWKRKFKKSAEHDMNNVALSEDHISTHHPENFKFKVLNRRQVIIDRLEERFGLSLSL